MARTRRQILGATALAALVVTVTYACYGAALRWSLESLSEEGRGRLAIYASSLRNEISRFDYLPSVLAGDKDMLALLADPSARSLIDAVNRRLATISASSGAAAIYVVNGEGITQVASNWNLPGSYVGQDYSFRPYFLDALSNGRGRYFGIGATTGRPGYFLSSAAGVTGNVGVTVVKVDLDPLEIDWGKASDRVILSDQNDIVFLSSVPGWKYRPLFELTDQARNAVRTTMQYAANDLLPITAAIDKTRAEDAVSIAIPGETARVFCLVAMPLQEFGWTLRYLVDVRQAQIRAAIAATLAGLLLVMIAALLYAWRQRWLRLRGEREHHRMLEIRVDQRTLELRETNVRLVNEMAERQRATEALVAAQNEVVQAGKMSALGQMAAAIVHEINQPIAAIRTFSASGQFLARSVKSGDLVEVLGHIGRLTEKMATITSHLKVFARKSPAGRYEEVSLAATASAALDLHASRIARQNVSVDNTIDGQAAIGGDAIRLEQVLVNLIGNALDAMEDVQNPTLTMRTRLDDENCWHLDIIDNGAGLSADSMQHLFEPFFTTKLPGKGLGLGLPLSMRIVTEFGGRLSACNNVERGAVFMVQIPAYDEARARGSKYG